MSIGTIPPSALCIASQVQSVIEGGKKDNDIIEAKGSLLPWALPTFAAYMPSTSKGNNFSVI